VQAPIAPAMVTSAQGWWLALIPQGFRTKEKGLAARHGQIPSRFFKRLPG